MAIIIPSSKTYNRQNPKIRDNVIERIEVGAVEIVPNNDYETPVYNESFMDNLKTTTESHTGNLGFDLNGVSGARYYSWALISSSQSFFTINLNIPKVKQNKYINKIYDQKKQNGENWIGVNVVYTLKKGSANVPLTNITYGSNYEMTSYKLGDISKSQPQETIESVGEIPNAKTTYSYVANSAQVGSQAIAVSTVTFTQSSNISTIKHDNTDKDFIKFNGIKIMSGSQTINLGSGYSLNMGSPTDINLTGTYEEYEAVKIEITIYGNTIGIDLTDKTVYINGETAKKVHSIDGNELMQTTNYKYENKTLIENTDYWIGTSQYGSSYYTSVHLYNQYPLETYIDYTMPNGDKKTVVINPFATTHSPAIGSTGGYVTIDKVRRTKYATTYEEFKKTQENYKNGKETATIRCSISDYYNQVGEKIIAIDNSTNKMSFDEYDEVIPMVYGADGKDRYMSTKKDGSPKTFKVLGVKPFYDGAVWQELYLQEA